MTAIIIIALIWGICKLISAASRKVQADRAERERQRIREEQAEQRAVAKTEGKGIDNS